MQFNQSVEIGYVGEDPKEIIFPNGGKVVTFSICVSEKARQPGDQDYEMWIEIQPTPAWTDYAMKIKKGDNVIVIGKLKQDKWKDKTTGQDRTKHKIIAFQVGILPRDQANPLPQSSPPYSARSHSVSPRQSPPSVAAPPIHDDEGYVPF